MVRKWSTVPISLSYTTPQVISMLRRWEAVTAVPFDGDVRASLPRLSRAPRDEHAGAAQYVNPPTPAYVKP
jgi:hypothetical protein